MPDDNFDVDKFMAERRKSASGQQPATPAPSFDVDTFMRERRQSPKPQPRNLLPTERQQFNVRRLPSLDESLNQSAQANRGRSVSRRVAPAPPEPQITPDSTTGPIAESLRDQSRREFAQRPLTRQVGERAYDALARGFQPIAKHIRQVGGLIGSTALNPYVPPQEIPETRFERERNAELEQRQLNRPTGGFATQTGEAILEGLGPAAEAYLAAEAKIPAALIGGLQSASSADFSNPTKAATQIALGAAAPVVGGKIGSKVGGAIANRLSRPITQAAARAGGEVLGGGLGNAGATAGEQLAFEGKLNPREILKSGIVGGALSAPGALGAARRGALPPEVAQPLREAPNIAPNGANAPMAPRPEQVSAIQPEPVTTGAEPTPPQPPTVIIDGKPHRVTVSARRESDGIRVSAIKLHDDETGTYRQILPPDRGVRFSSFDEAQAEATKFVQDAFRQQVAQPAPVASRRQLPNEAVRQTTEIPRVEAPPTQRIQYPDAPETQEIPAIRERIAAENAPTRELPRQITAPEEAPPRPPTERLPVPKATDENIQALRSRQEELGRLAYDRRGDFTGDLRDEYNQITAHIRDYENARAPREIGPPPGQRPEAPPNPQERSARRAALEPKPPELPETLTPGRPVTQEVQIPRLKPSETFSSREDARQGHFEQFNDQELVDEIDRMQEIKNQATRGRSKLSPQELEANNFDLKVAIEQQKERGRLQRQIGIEPGQRIAPRTPARFKGSETAARKINHSTFGEVTEAPDQASIPKGKLRVTDADGADHVIQNPRTRGNQNAAFTKAPPKAKSLAQFVKDAGGIKPSIANRGELSYVSTKESNRVAIINRRGIPADEMRRAAIESGYGHWDTEGEFLSALRDDVEGRKVFSKEREVDYEAEYRKSLNTGEHAELQSFENFLNDKDAAAAYDKVTGGDVSGESVKQLLQYAERHGLADDAIEAIINEGHAARQRSRQGPSSTLFPNNARSQGQAPSEAQLNKPPINYTMPAEAVPELREPNAPPSPLAGKALAAKAGPRESFTIQAEAAPDLSRPTRPPAANPDALARAIGKSPSDGGKVKVADLGLESKTAPSRSADAKAIKRNISIDDITLGRDDLSKGRMFQVQEALKGGVKPERRGVRGSQQITSIEVVPDPAKPGKYIVDNDGNHRIALLKLQGYRGDVPVTAYEAPQGGQEHVEGFGLGALFAGGKKPQSGQQPLFEQPKRPGLSRKEVAETAGSVQAVSQLGTPRFALRNILQHVAYGKQERTATRLAAAIDFAYSKLSGQPRQVYAPRGSDLTSYVRNFGKAVEAYKKGEPLPGKPNVDYATADANKVDKAVGKVLTWLNEIPDAANWQTRFEDALQSITGSRQLRAPLDAEAVIEQATAEANHASLRDKNFVSDALGYIKKGLNKASSPITGTDKFGLGDFVAKYTQVPGALLKRGLERSPLGLFQVAKEATTPGPFRRRNTLLALSRVAEGTATGVSLGAGLAAAGVLVGPEDESKTGQGFEREQGVRGYSLNASALGRFLTGGSTKLQEGDNLYSIDWLQPWALNLSSGAALWNLHKDGKLGAVSGAKASGEAVYNSLARTLDVIGDQSVLKNVGRYIDKASGDTFGAKFFSVAKQIGLDVPGSFVPSLARQTRQVVDPFERDTRPEQRGGLGGFVEEAKNRALAQLPGVSSRFPARPSLLTGEDRKTALGEFSAPARVAAQFSPANASTYTPRPVAQEISRLNRAGEKVSISFPAPITNKRTSERESTSSLRGRERRFAETFSRMSKDLIADPFYKDADNETKAAAFAGLKRHLANLGKEDFEEKSIDEIVEAAMEAVERKKAREAAQ